MSAKAFPVPAQAVETQDVEQKQSLLDKIMEQQAEVASRYQPVMDFKQLIERYKLMQQLKDTVLVDGEDYVRIPGVDKPFLSKAGAQKLCVFFGYVPHYTILVEVEDWDGHKFGEPLFYYKFTCRLEKDGKAVGEGIGSANSWESKYRYRWVGEADAKRQHDWKELITRDGSVSEPNFAITKGETSGKYGKPAEYWERFRLAIQNGTAKKVKKQKKDGGTMDAWEIDAALYRVPNDQFPDVINTCQKMGLKRAMVEATLSATGLTNLFSQDEEAVEDPLSDAKTAMDNATPVEQPKKAAPAANGGRPIPEEMRVILAGLKDQGTVTAAFSLLEKQLSDVAGPEGIAAYNRVLDAEEARLAGKQQTLEDIKGVLLRLYEAYQKMGAEQHAGASK